MGKHERGYERVERDLYETPSWPVEVLLDHVQIKGKTIWEPACGNGQMVRVLRQHAKRVYATDIVRHGRNKLDGLVDFTHRVRPKMGGVDAIISNPPFGPRGLLAVEFIRAGLWHLEHGCALLALLLPSDFDSAATRAEFFGECPLFAAKLVLTKRITWFERSDGIKAAPKENSCWYLWRRSGRLSPPALLYQRT